MVLYLIALLVLLTFPILCWETVNEIPDRSHLPFLNPEPASTLSSPAEIFHLNQEPFLHQHSISELVHRADDEHKRLLHKQTKGLKQAAQAYRQRRGRHPPPWFNGWVEFPESHESLMIEEMFDWIYDDLDPSGR